MTVQELIDALQAIEDKTLPVVFAYSDDHNHEMEINSVHAGPSASTAWNAPKRNVCALEEY